MDPFDLASLAPKEAPLDEMREALPFSFARPAEALAESIASLGLLRPLLVQSQGPRLRLLAGNLRRRALRLLGRTSAPAVFLPPQAPALAMALADNRERPVNPAETALVWRRLAETLGEGQAGKLAGFLGLDRSKKLRDLNFQAAALPPRGLGALADGRLDLAAAARLARWPAADQEAALDLFEALRPSQSNRRAWLDWLEDLGRREGRSPAGILADADFQALFADQGDRAEAKARELLFRRRHPELAELRQKRAEQLRALGLPPAARLALDPSFEDFNYRLTLTFTDLTDFQALAGLVGGLGLRPEFRALLDD